MNLSEYLKLEVPKSDFLLDPTKGSKVAFPFTIGKNEIVFYGQPIILTIKSPIFNVLDVDQLSNNPKLATQFELTNVNLPGLVLVWLWMNGLIQIDNTQEGEDQFAESLSEYSLLDILVALEWIDYFNLSDEFSYIIQEIMNVRLFNESRDLSDEEKTLLQTRLGKLSLTFKNLVLYKLKQEPKNIEFKQYEDASAILHALYFRMPNLTEFDKKWLERLKQQRAKHGNWYVPDTYDKLMGIG